MKAEGRTIVFVTHDMAAVERFCDRAMLIERGRMLDIGSPDERLATLHRAQLRRARAAERRKRRNPRPLV